MTCVREANVCLEELGRTVGLVSFLFCVEEGVDMACPNAAFVVKDAFLCEIERGLDDLPGMKVSERKRFSKRLKLRFFSALNGDEFARPLVSQFVEMLDSNRELPNGVLS